MDRLISRALPEPARRNVHLLGVELPVTTEQLHTLTIPPIISVTHYANRRQQGLFMTIGTALGALLIEHLTSRYPAIRSKFPSSAFHTPVFRHNSPSPPAPTL